MRAWANLSLDFARCLTQMQRCTATGIATASRSRMAEGEQVQEGHYDMSRNECIKKATEYGRRSYVGVDVDVLPGSRVVQKPARNSIRTGVGDDLAPEAGQLGPSLFHRTEVHSTWTWQPQHETTRLFTSFF